MIGYRHHTVVYLSVRPSVTLCIVSLRVSVGSRKFLFLERHFRIHLFRHFCCMMYNTWSFSHNTRRKPNRRNLRVWNSHGQRDHVTMAIQTRRLRRLCSAAITYFIGSRIGLLNDSYYACCYIHGLECVELGELSWFCVMLTVRLTTCVVCLCDVVVTREDSASDEQDARQVSRW